MSLYGKTDTTNSIPKFINNGQIVAVNVTNKGSGYTAIPTVTIAAPTAGVQAEASALVEVASVASVTAGGTGYAVGDILTIVGGTGRKAQLKVATLSTTAVATVTILSTGSYSSLSGLTVSGAAHTGGSGTDATFSLTFKVAEIVLTNKGSGYVAADLAGVTFNPASTTAAAVVKHGSTFASGSDVGKTVVFISTEEAVIAANIKKGLNAPGWWMVQTYFDSAGTVRYKCERLVATAGKTSLNATTGDASDDTIAADTNVTITVTQPTAQSATQAVGTATFAVTGTTASAGTLTYQWQKKLATGTRWINISGKTAASCALSGLTVAADHGSQYRVVIGSDAGAAKVYSNAVTLTVTLT
jgi:hypothetical protein